MKYSYFIIIQLMGIFTSVIQTDPIKWKVQVDEVKHKSNIVQLEKIIQLIKRDYQDPIANLVKEQLKKECALAMNFTCKITKHSDMYDTTKFYQIIAITGWHKHCDSGGYQNADFEFVDYVIKLFNGDYETNLNFKSECKCLLSKKQRLLYENLVNYQNNKIFTITH